MNLTVSIREPGEVTGDRSQLVTAVANLVANAIVYSHEGARVAVAAQRATQDGDDVVVREPLNGRRIVAKAGALLQAGDVVDVAEGPAS